MRVLIADYRTVAGDQTALHRLTAAGVEVVHNPHGRRLTPEELVDLAAGCQGVIAGSERYEARILDGLPALKCISRVGVGVDSIDKPAAEQRGITVCTTSEAHTRSVAEFTVGLMLAALRGIASMDRQVRAGQWRPYLGLELRGAKVGLVGLGRVGREVARLLHGYDCELYGCDAIPVREWAERANVRIVPFEVLLRSVDIVSLHLPHTPDTHHLMNHRTLALMRPGSYLINTSRGGLVDEDALYILLAEGRLAGSALDVFADEPYEGRLATLETVILTAHAASHTAEARRRMEREAVENLLNVLLSRQGELPEQG